jgi:hypothetical protein
MRFNVVERVLLVCLVVIYDNLKKFEVNFSLLYYNFYYSNCVFSLCDSNMRSFLSLIFQDILTNLTQSSLHLFYSFADKKSWINHSFLSKT